tara:strand:+ start:984 stop:1091 length:108 start_codon:yes stop_codon:yes gene_type:complete
MRVGSKVCSPDKRQYAGQNWQQISKRFEAKNNQST